MHSIFKRFREPIFVIALLAIPFAIFFVKAKKGRELSALDRAIIFAIAPVEKIITLAAFGVVDAWNGYAALRGVHEENVQLRREGLKARQLEQQSAELRLENERLRHLLDFVDKQSAGRVMIARVVADVADAAGVVTVEVTVFVLPPQPAGLDAFTSGDPDRAQTTIARDDEVDELYDRLYDQVIDAMKRDASTVSRGAEWLFVLKHLERIADYVTNICEQIVCMARGQVIKHTVW